MLKDGEVVAVRDFFDVDFPAVVLQVRQVPLAQLDGELARQEPGKSSQLSFDQLSAAVDGQKSCRRRVISSTNSEAAF